MSTVQEVFEKYGVKSMRQLADRMSWTTQHAWNVYNGYVKIGARSALEMEDKLGIPMREIMAADPGEKYRDKREKSQA